MSQDVIFFIVLALGAVIGLLLACITFTLRQIVAERRHKPVGEPRVSSSAEPTLESIQASSSEPAASFCELPSDPSAPDDWIGQRLKERCEDTRLYLDPDLSSETLARVLETNRTYLSRFFNSRGCSFNQYINSLRVKYAITRINASAQRPNVTDIARESGFTQMNSFRSAFKMCTGILPSEYVNKCFI